MTRADRLASKAARLFALFAIAYYGAHLAHSMPSWPESVAVGLIVLVVFVSVGWLLGGPPASFHRSTTMNDLNAALHNVVGGAIRELRDSSEGRWIDLAQRLALARDAALDAARLPVIDKAGEGLREALKDAKYSNHYTHGAHTHERGDASCGGEFVVGNCVVRAALASPPALDAPEGIVQRSHIACCWCGEHHEEGD